MVTYYTSLGRMITKDENGERVPMIVIDEKEYAVSINELIVWGSTHWNFLNKTDLENEYMSRKREAHVFDDVPLESVLARLEVRGLVKTASDYVAANALYKLVSELTIRPIKFSVADKIKSCLYLYFKKGVPLKVCYKAYFASDYSKNEKKVLKLTKSVCITTSEIIRCAEKNIDTISDEGDLMDKIYDSPDVTSDTINTGASFSQLRTDILQAVANLYLKKKIVFE